MRRTTAYTAWNEDINEPWYTMLDLVTERTNYQAFFGSI